MARKKKHPEHKAEAERLMKELLDLIVQIWTSEKDPELKVVAEETELSPAKIRKLLITAGERDEKTYYESPMALQVLSLSHKGKSIKEIGERTGLSYSSIQGYLPHSKIIYSLDTLSTEAVRIRLYRMRQKAVSELHDHIGLPNQFEYLWKTVIAFEGFVFSTSGRGKEKSGATRFKYTVSKPAGTGGRHYDGTDVDGYGNEIMVEGKEKSISRSTIDLALKKALEQGGRVKGPKTLGLPGSGSYLYPMLIRFGMIEAD
jgi:hypothetical protein